jgi:putative spermidine/putrescine transport system permease protein
VSEAIRTSDGELLSVKLKKVESRRRLTAFLLVAPLLLFILAAYIFPILQMMTRSVDNRQMNELLSKTHIVIQQWDGKEMPGEDVTSTFYYELKDLVANKKHGKIATRLNYEKGGFTSLIKKTARKLDSFDESGNFLEQFMGVHKRWKDKDYWLALKRGTVPYHGRKYLTAFDYEQKFDGSFEKIPEKKRINVTLWLRTIFVAVGVTFSCFLLAYPIAHILSVLPARYSNLLMICVLLPFWTSLLVRTSSWMVLLQKQGVLNDILVWAGFVADDGRLELMYNMTGTFIAMSQILLPFMVLPLYSVMKTIPPSLMRAATSMGATPFHAFRKIYFPLTYPGISAGSILVFVLAIGYYITPALVGGSKGVLISNRIAYHMQKSLDWGLATAMAAVLLIAVLIVYWLYNRLVGIDNMRLG